MPRRRRSSKVKSRARGRGRRQTTKRLVRFRRPMGLPRVFTCKMKYVDFIELDPSAGAPALHKYRVNSVYDPDYTGVVAGHQPSEFDNISQVYRRYKVTSSRIKVEGLAKANGTVPTWLVLETQDHDLNTNPSLRNLLENGAKAVRIDPVVSSTATMNTFSYKGNQQSLIKNWSIRRDIPQHLRGGEALNAGISQNPAEQMYFSIQAMANDIQTATNPGAIICKVELTFNVTFYDEKEHEES